MSGIGASPSSPVAEAPVSPAFRSKATTSPWRKVTLLYLCGLLAAAQLGKLSALAPLVAHSLDLSLPTVAIAISLIEVGGATLGAVAGMVAHRIGLRRSLLGGVAFLALAGLGASASQGIGGLIGWRLFESLGYVAVVVTAPVLIAQRAAAAGPRIQGLAMTLWSTFVPVGLALGAAGSASAAAAVGWRGAMIAGGLAGLLLLGVLWRSSGPLGKVRPAAHGSNAPAARDKPASAPPPSRLPRAIWFLALAFGGFTLFEVGVIGLLPTLLVQTLDLSPASAGHWTAAASISAVGGSLISAWLMRHGGGMRWPIALSLAMPPLLLFGVFTPSPVAPVAIGLALLLNVLGGMFASLAFALLPRLAGEPGQMVRANGLLAQCGAAGSLLGPPTMAACVKFSGWPAAAVLGLVASFIAVPLAWRAATAATRPGTRKAPGI